ncbi:ester cyclase [Nonomuraea spiralis]|uniref:ester cyclase n=1 Tax=Nonomuraea spiralis TaxID=46182 RepID=UPI0037877034
MLTRLYERWLLDLWNGDLALAHDLVTPDFVGHWPGRDVHGPDELAETIRQGHEPFDDVRLTLDVGPVVDGDMVAARWTFSGAYRGGLPGASAPPGSTIAFAGHDLLRATDGRFSEYWVISDAQTFSRQLGIG